MFIGHIPAGYISTNAVFRILPQRCIEKICLRYALLWGTIGSIFPDFDIFYLLLIGKRPHLHHKYWTHIPFYWVCIFLLIFSIVIAYEKRALAIYLWIFSLNIFIHLFLDTIVGNIRWLYPFSSDGVVFFHVPALYNWGVWKFVFHWTFLFEIVIVAIATLILRIKGWPKIRIQHNALKPMQKDRAV